MLLLLLLLLTFMLLRLCTADIGVYSCQFVHIGYPPLVDAVGNCFFLDIDLQGRF